MNITMILLRLIHIIFGVFWAGGSFLMTLVIGPTAQELGADAAKFMQQLALRSKMGIYMSIAGGSVVLTGLIMYFRLFGGIKVNTGAGLALTLGGIFGVLSFIMGFTSQKGNADKIKALVDGLSGPPSPEIGAQIGVLQEKMAKGGALTSLLMVLTLIGMTLSEYFAF